MSGSNSYFKRLEAIDTEASLMNDNGLAWYNAAQQAAREEITPPLTFEELFVLKELGLAHEYISEALAEHD